MKLVDLSKTLSEDLRVYGGDPKISLLPFYTYEKNNCSLTKISLGSHAGTHADAPSHFIRGGKDISELDPAHFAGSARCFAAENITAEFLADATASLSGEKILLISTGRDGFDDLPFFPPETAEILSRAGIITLGIDSPSLEPSREMHTALLSREIVIIEGLCNLNFLPNEGFLFAAPPPKYPCDGAPLGAYAIIDI